MGCYFGFGFFLGEAVCFFFCFGLVFGLGGGWCFCVYFFFSPNKQLIGLCFVKFDEVNS